MTNRSRYVLYKALSVLLFFMPILALVALERDAFIKAGATKLSLYGYILLILIAVTLKEKCFDFAKKNVSLSLSLFLFVTALVMRYFSTELLYIGIAGIVGSVLSAFVSPVESVYYHLCYEDTVGGKRKRITSDDVPSKEGFKRAYL